MMTSKSSIVAFAFFMAVLSGCTATQKPSVNEATDTSGTTGYWYLGDNGERQWRTLNPADIPAPAPAVRKNYASSVGNGSGKG
ncbi:MULTISPECIES: hypothetical protein [Bartonella]|uniref:hypothetical protein n=1 Tax=Bartonella TaxID=773 RepID=UPI0018DC27CA|nr:MULTISPECIES: hypothetical protein [Bartonella]MBH9994142.1 hypothetical protein [Bartonella sp. P0291]MBH9997513.1 hypothetical protein [Bartonella sp. M0192]MBH9999673.1 hypothetical protein [Bartonella sp. M0191]MBI0008246.1 hypothetical protein [Bartonella sp. M0193]MBI0010964.1 hypothetical protein [Bartonella sp. M0176]